MGNLGVVITTVQGQEQYLELLVQVLCATDKNSDIVLVDDGEKGEEVPLHSAVKYVSTSGRITGYGMSVNLGVNSLNGEQYVAILHDDIRLPENFSFEPFIKIMEEDELVGAIVPMLLKPRQTITESFSEFISSRGNQLIRAGFVNWYPDYPPANEQRTVDLMKSGFIFIRRSVFDQVEGYDDTFSPFGFEDFDLSLRIRSAGYNLLYVPSIKATHLVAQTINHDFWEPEKLGEIMNRHLETFKERWGQSPLVMWRKDDV